jgi:hypothetical protein
MDDDRKNKVESRGVAADFNHFQSCCIPVRVEQAFRPALKLLKKSTLSH